MPASFCAASGPIQPHVFSCFSVELHSALLLLWAEKLGSKDRAADLVKPTNLKDLKISYFFGNACY